MKTRKEHKCCECGETIPIGSRANHIKMLFEGDWSSDYTCIPCSNVRKTFSCAGIGELREFIMETEFFDYTEIPVVD